LLIVYIVCVNAAPEKSIAAKTVKSFFIA